MDGCWTLEGLPEGKWPMVQRGPWIQDREQVPVVPCDDAAIERGARALARGYGREDMWGEYATLAEAVLRAAGGALAFRGCLRADGETP